MVHREGKACLPLLNGLPRQHMVGLKGRNMQLCGQVGSSLQSAFTVWTAAALTLVVLLQVC